MIKFFFKKINKKESWYLWDFSIRIKLSKERTNEIGFGDGIIFRCQFCFSASSHVCGTREREREKRADVTLGGSLFDSDLARRARVRTLSIDPINICEGIWVEGLYCARPRIITYQDATGRRTHRILHTAAAAQAKRMHKDVTTVSIYRTQSRHAWPLDSDDIIVALAATFEYAEREREREREASSYSAVPLRGY